MKKHLTRGSGALLLAAFAAVALFALAACGGSGGGAYGNGGGGPATTPPPSGGDAVSIANFAFSPQTLTVAAGTTVTWTNDDSSPHTVLSTDGPGTDAATTSLFDSGSLADGETFSFTFDAAGTYYYECSIHASTTAMHGQVVVQ